MGPFEVMLAEHRAIKNVLSAWEALGKSSHEAHRIDAAATADFLRFFRRFADHLHHGKEEQILFDFFAELGIDATVGLISQLVREHEQMRGELRGVESSSLLGPTEGALDAYLSHLEAYASLLRNHIRVEDDFLFGMAEILFDERSQRLLGERFSEHDQLLEAERTELLELGARLCDRFGQPRPSWPARRTETPSATAASPVWPLDARPLRVAIVGAGPAGFFAASSLLNQTEVPVEVDILDRLPSPYGLVRAGVAPDHDRIKTITQVFERCAVRPGLSYFGNVELGRDVQAWELLRLYDEVIYATGSELDRRLGIPGDGSAGTTPATVMVGWYNGHPDYVDAVPFDPKAKQVAVVGNGNVALDIVRILVRSREELRRTDIAEHALAQLKKSELARVVVLGRRTIYDASFGNPELRELVNLEGVRIVVRPEELDPAVIGDLTQVSPAARTNFELLREAANRAPKEARIEVEFRFMVSPEAILTDQASHTRALTLVPFERVVQNDGTVEYRRGEVTQELPVGWVYTAIGYRTRPIPGVPYDTAHGLVPNRDGRVIDPDSGALRDHEYCVGWAQSGARGVIGTHKRGAATTVAALLRQVVLRGANERPERVGGIGLSALLERRQVRSIGFGAWQKIDSVEVERGSVRGAPRSKITSIDEMLAAAGLS